MQYGKIIYEETYVNGKVRNRRKYLEHSVKISHRQNILTELLKGLESLDKGEARCLTIEVFTNDDKGLERLVMRHEVNE